MELTRKGPLLNRSASPVSYILFSSTSSAGSWARGEVGPFSKGGCKNLMPTHMGLMVLFWTHCKFSSAGLGVFQSLSHRPVQGLILLRKPMGGNIEVRVAVTSTNFPSPSSYTLTFIRILCISPFWLKVPGNLWGLTRLMFMGLVVTMAMTELTAHNSPSKGLRGKMGREFESGKIERGLLDGFIVFSSLGKLKRVCVRAGLT